LYPDLPLPPDPCPTRFGTWVVAANFSAENYNALEEVKINTFCIVIDIMQWPMAIKLCVQLFN